MCYAVCRVPSSFKHLVDMEYVKKAQELSILLFTAYQPTIFFYYLNLNLNCLLVGNNQLNLNSNIDIFLAVQKYIVASKRFQS